MSSAITDQAVTKSAVWALVAGVVLTLFLIFLGHIYAGDVNERQRLDRNERYGAGTSTEQRVKAVGQINVASSTSITTASTQVAVSSTAIDGEKVYGGICVACHAAGVAGAPRVGDQTAWTGRISKGLDTLYSNAINGFQGDAGVMPAKGGKADLSDDEVRAAVDFMLAKSK